MRKLWSLAVAAMLPITACTTAPMASSTAANGDTLPSGTQFCKKNHLGTGGGQLQCSWMADRKQACQAHEGKSLDAGRYTEPEYAGRCENGENLVRVSPKA